MMITLIGIIVGILSILLLMYIFIGLAMTISLRKGIRKIWSEEEDLKDHSILWAYLTGVFLWPRVDWNNVEYHNNWAISIEKGKHEEEI